MAGSNLLATASISPQVLYSDVLSATEAALYTVPALGSAKITNASICNRTSGQLPPVLTLSVLNATLAAPVITKGTTATSGGTFGAGTYYWKVTATNAFGETTGSNEVNATLVSTGTQVISWSVIGGATGYKVYRGTGAGAQNILVTTIGSGATTTYTDTGTAGTAGTVPVTDTSGGGTFAAATYYWTVTAKSAAGETIASNEISGAVGLNGSQNISWTTVPAAAQYSIYRGTAAGVTNKILATVNAGTTAFLDTGTAGSTQSPPTTSTFAIAAKVNVSICKSGATLDGTHRVLQAYSLAVDTSYSLKDLVGEHMLGAGDFIAANATIAGAVVLVVSGTVHA